MSVMYKSGLLLLMTFISSPLMADAINDKYVFIGIGSVYSEAESDISISPWDTRTDTDTGLLFNAGYGQRIGSNIRLEGEVAYRTLDIDNLTKLPSSQPVLGANFQGGKGDLSSLSLMANGWYDFNNDTNWTPYIGGGLGFSLISLDNLYATTLGVFPGATPNKISVDDDEDWQFSYQIGAGISYKLNEKFNIDLDYRYVVVSDGELQTTQDQNFDVQMKNSNLLLKLKYLF